MAVHKWSEEEIEFIREIYPYHENKEISKMVKDKFGFEVSATNLLNVRHNYKIPKKAIPNSGCYRKGDVPWNKGKGMSDETREKVKKTWFKKGEIPKNHRPVGSTRITVDGYTEIKIAEPNKWALYHRHLYEVEHGEKLKKNEAIIFADGDKTNFDIDNLLKVSRANLLYLNNKKLIFDDPELTKTGVNVSKVVEKINNLEKGGLNETKTSV